jgi:hypothetical protein
MNATIMTVAKLAAVKAVKARAHAQGLKAYELRLTEINAAATVYLREHPELINEAAVTVANSPQLRAMAEREPSRR